MRPGQQQQQNKRMRGRGRKGPNPLSRSYESNGPDVKIRGNAQHIAEKYTTLARDASAAGDRVMAENYLQHAEHYGRIVAAAQGTFQLQRDESEGFDGEYEDGDEEGLQDNGGSQNGQAYPVAERPQQQPNQMQGNRDNQNGRDYQAPREGQNQGRDYQGPRDGQGQRDGQNQGRDYQGNREQRFNRDDRNRNREFGRDRNRDQQRDNRTQGDNRPQGEERRQWEGRDRQNGQDRQIPNGLGPQPMVGETPAVENQAPAMRQPEREQPRVEQPVGERRDEAPVVVNAPVTDQSAGFEPAVPAEAVSASEPAGEAERPSGEVRRRGRPRRPRFGEAEASRAGEGATPESVPEPIAAAAPPAPSLAPAADAVPVEGASEAPVKRRPGRPRKKKPEDEGGDGGGELPAFLLASNG